MSNLVQQLLVSPPGSQTAQGSHSDSLQTLIGEKCRLASENVRSSSTRPFSRQTVTRICIFFAIDTKQEVVHGNG